MKSGADMAQTSFIWHNGCLLPLQEACLSPIDHGFMVGDGVFETLVARKGQPFAAHEHYLRLQHSCQVMELTCLDEVRYNHAIRAVLVANNLQDARVRVTLSSGAGPLGSDRGQAEGTVVVVATPLKPWPLTEQAVLVPWTRNSRSALAGVKSVSYGENVRALHWAKQRGAGEALFENEKGELCEGTGSNVFLVWQGRLVTPPLESGCLAGITRALVLKACAEAKIPCYEESVPAGALEECEEAFLTSSTRDVHPLAKIGTRELSAPGPVTRQVQAAFATYSAQLALSMPDMNLEG